MNPVKLLVLLVAAGALALAGCTGRGEDPASAPAAGMPAVVDQPGGASGQVPFPPTIMERQELPVLNGDRPGEALTDPSLYASRGRTTVLEFFSRRCAASFEMNYLLERLATLRRDLVIRRIDIDRPGQPEIDFDSPLARQFHLEKVPYFIIFDPAGRFQAQGDPAKAMVKEWMHRTGVVERN